MEAGKKNKELDIEIQPEKLKTALNGDEVEFKTLKSKIFDRPQGEVTKIVSRAKEQFVGVIEKEKGIYFLVPDDTRFYKDIVIDAKGLSLEPNSKAQVKIVSWEEGKNPVGKIIKLIGKKGDNNAEMESIVLEKGFDTGFPADVESEAEEIKKNEIPIPAEEIAKRKDFRKTLTFTIDPVDAKDFDDAISFKRLGADLFEIGVHIADVSHYVREKTALDKEASKRGLSVYLVDRTIPMLPEILSNNICSLMPHQDRLAFSAVFEMNSKGDVLKRWFGKTIIHSHKRFSYETAQELLDSKSTEKTENKDCFEELTILNNISKKLAEDKFAAGAIDFERDEVKFELDAKGKPLRVYKKERLDTHKLVENYMLLANREVPEYIFQQNRDHKKKEGAFIYRIHDTPDQERLLNLSIFVKALGYDLEAHDGTITSQSIKKLLAQIEGKPEESMIKTSTLRSMAKAIYSTQNIGHFGLAFKHYTHFTSPIRRYPDLLVHRVLFAYLQNKKIGDHEMPWYQSMAEKSTKREILASEAERASIKYKQVEYMQDKVGKIFEGTITGVTDWGIYVEENETKCEGMIKLRDLGDDFYILDEKNYAVIGEKTKKKFRLGDAVTFKVMAADMERKSLNYQLERS
jgi:ribonuclease R